MYQNIITQYFQNFIKNKDIRNFQNNYYYYLLFRLVRRYLNSYLEVKKRVEGGVGFYDAPYIRFEGKETQQETFFVEDPNFNMLEIKSPQGSYYKSKDK